MTARKGKRRAAVLLALSSEPKRLNLIAKETGLKWQVVSDILESPSMARLVEYDDGVYLLDTPEVKQAQVEARELMKACATVQASEQPDTQPVNHDHHSTVSGSLSLPGSLAASPRVGET